MTGACVTVMARLWTAGVPTPFEAVIVTLYVPLALVAGAPAIVAVPLVVLARKLSPGGSVPLSLSVGCGDPELVSVRLVCTPACTMKSGALVIAGALVTVMASVCTAALPTPFEAVIVTL
jgi:hypothetical protein